MINFKCILFLLCVGLLQGCTQFSKKPNQEENALLALLELGSAEFSEQLSAQININQADHEGRTLLHLALATSSLYTQSIIDAGASLDTQDRLGLTPLHIAVLYSPHWVRPLLKMDTATNINSHQLMSCYKRPSVYLDAQWKLHRSQAGGMGTALELATQCERTEALTEYSRFHSDVIEWKYAQNTHTAEAYQTYLDNHLEPMFALSATQALAELKQATLAQWKRDQKCAVNEDGWYYLEGECKGHKAHGKGVAVTADEQRFEGVFNKGDRHMGRYFHQDVLVFDGEFISVDQQIDYASGRHFVKGVLEYDGPFLDGQYHGDGFCRYEGAMEVCTLYQGERVDALYKQRMALREAAEQEKARQEEIQALKQEVAQLKEDVNNSEDDDDDMDLGDLGYVKDLHHKDNFRRNTARVRAAWDIFQFFSE